MWTRVPRQTKREPLVLDFQTTQQRHVETLVAAVVCASEKSVAKSNSISPSPRETT